MTSEIWGIFTRALESLKIGTLMGSFYPKSRMNYLKIYRGLCVMTMNSNTKFVEELVCHFNIDMWNLRNFDSSTWKSKKIAL